MALYLNNIPLQQVKQTKFLSSMINQNLYGPKNTDHLRWKIAIPHGYFTIYDINSPLKT